jgi:uncharacterized small protein (DUF1192 family)
MDQLKSIGINKLNERAVYLRREIAWWESELEEVYQ